MCNKINVIKHITCAECGTQIKTVTVNMLIDEFCELEDGDPEKYESHQINSTMEMEYHWYDDNRLCSNCVKLDLDYVH